MLTKLLTMKYQEEKRREMEYNLLEKSRELTTTANVRSISPHEGVMEAHVQTSRNRYPAGATSQHTRGYANA